jgi:hypothetical protein
MGTPLTPAQRTEWYDYFKDMDAARRTRFADLMAAAPVDAAESAYTLNDLQILDDVDDVQESVADVAGMRKADVRYFMQYWRAHGDAADVSNKPVAVARAMVVATAAVARGDAPAMVAEAVAHSIVKAAEDADDVEGKSIFCYALLRLKTDSSKLGKVAKLGVDPEELDYILSEKGFEINTAEWKQHVKSSRDWHDYSRKLKRSCRQHQRFGLVNRLTEFTDKLDEMEDWEVASAYIELYFDEHQTRLPVAHDSELYLSALRRVRGSSLAAIGGALLGGGPPPKAIKGPSGAVEQAIQARQDPAEPSAWELFAGRVQAQVDHLRELMEGMTFELGAGARGKLKEPRHAPPGLTPGPPEKEKRAVTFEDQAEEKPESLDEAAEGKKKKKSKRSAGQLQQRADRWKAIREHVAEQRTAREARQASEARGERRGFVPADEWDKMSGSQRAAVVEQRRLADGGEARPSKKRRDRSPDTEEDKEPGPVFEELDIDGEPSAEE